MTRLRTRLAWWLHETALRLLSLSARVQGDAPGPWHEEILVTGNQFVTVEFARDD